MTYKYFSRHAVVASLLAISAVSKAAPAPRAPQSRTQEMGDRARQDAELLDPDSLAEVKAAYRHLIEAENTKDIETMKRMVWNSPSTLILDKIATVPEGEWPGIWGYEAVIQRLHQVTEGVFQIAPDYSRIKVVGLTHNLAECYAPVRITVASSGQTPVSKPVLMIINWIRTSQGWKMASNFAIPMPPPPTQDK